jgi:hypothetical protein
MYRRYSMLCTIAFLFELSAAANIVSAAAMTGSLQTTSSLGQLLSMKLTITDSTTTFELTGPDYSYFAFGFDTTIMRGYSLIVEGLDSNRSVVEQNLLGRGNPGSPQENQNLTIVDVRHDEANNLTTLAVERANQTGDQNDPAFSTNMTSLDVIWAYNSNATPENPNGFLRNHGQSGRGFATIMLTPIPEPTSVMLVTIGCISLIIRRHRSLRIWQSR